MKTLQIPLSESNWQQIQRLAAVTGVDPLHYAITVLIRHLETTTRHWN
ncbi:MAG TPA: hypothetical protein PKL84_03685 [Candidatus Hydrogenedentes bacterium]|nr:hypothetical protein [Candidatus Hydrogenedentota bacterium]